MKSVVSNRALDLKTATTYNRSFLLVQMLSFSLGDEAERMILSMFRCCSCLVWIEIGTDSVQIQVQFSLSVAIKLKRNQISQH